ncbi:AfsA-related hotdog domain-containing protein [Streptomyces sp. E5N91]|uniref:AfsA-related hotdog domain-containing protein n=1 Tax=Streptomyces sp. E5N91 TaxID=1851996 RepID=UPI001EE886F1|nr:AfsA-related hotdog domain-containing protein [Streptomyces sp. E5N91]
MDVTRNGVPLGTACTRFAIQERAVYERLRGRYADIPGLRVLPLAPPASPARVGRLRFEDVVLSATDMSDRWQLRVDPMHPILFDHPVDHAPGMLILEAARQAALAATDPLRGVVTGMETVFHRYAELDEPCWIAANRLPGGPGGLRRVTVTGEQQGRPVFTCTVTLADASGS